MSNKVSAGSNTKQYAMQLRSFVGNDLPAHLDRLNKLADNLHNDPDFQGNHANTYRGQVNPSIHSSTKKMHADMAQVSQQLNTIIDNVLRAGGNGA